MVSSSLHETPISHMTRPARPSSLPPQAWYLRMSRTIVVFLALVALDTIFAPVNSAKLGSA